MELHFSDEQRLFADAIGRFLIQKHTFEARRAAIAGGRWGCEAVWRALADLGCLALVVPEADGGLGAGAVEAGILAREIGRHLVIEPVREVVHAALLLAGVDGGESELAAIMEGRSRYVVARPMDGHGRCIAIGGDAADGFLIVGDAGLQLVGADEVRIVSIRLLDDSSAAEMVVDAGCGRQLAGRAGWASCRAWADTIRTLFLCFETVGSMDAATGDTVRYVKERRQFGKAIADFQVVQHRVAEMTVATREADAVVNLAALTLAANGIGTLSQRAVAAAIHCIGSRAEFVADGAVQLHGGMGVSDETPVSGHFRKLQAFRLLAGSIDQAAASVVVAGLHRFSAVLQEG